MKGLSDIPDERTIYQMLKPILSSFQRKFFENSTERNEKRVMEKRIKEVRLLMHLLLTKISENHYLPNSQKAMMVDKLFNCYGIKLPDGMTENFFKYTINVMPVNNEKNV